MKRVSDIAEQETTVISLDPEPTWDDEAEVSKMENIYIKHLYGPLFFGFSSGFRSLTRALPDNVDILVVRMERVPHIDQSGLYALEDTMLELSRKDTVVALSGLNDQPADMLRRVGLIPNLVKEENIFDSFSECQTWLAEVAKNEKNISTT